MSIISIHAPNTGSDHFVLSSIGFFKYFNPRSQYRERHYSFRTDGQAFIFQSTLPIQGATRMQETFTLKILFQSTLPIQGATAADAGYTKSYQISIHAPNTGSDFNIGPEMCKPSFDFNPRSQYRERHAVQLFQQYKEIFQSTLPIQGATLLFVYIEPIN